VLTLINHEEQAVTVSALQQRRAPLGFPTISTHSGALEEPTLALLVLHGL
jgi:hypothetical protein